MWVTLIWIYCRCTDCVGCVDCLVQVNVRHVDEEVGECSGWVSVADGWVAEPERCRFISLAHFCALLFGRVAPSEEVQGHGK